MSTQITTKKVETLDDGDADELEAQVTPLFDLGRDKKTKAVIRIAVKRTDPDEGHLGYLPPDASEADIAHRWGGGEFVVQGKNAAGQIVVSHTVKIAGDPVFKSEIEEARWRRLNNLRPAKRREDDAGGGSIKDVLMLIEEREAKRREEERERRAEEKREQAEREDRNRREQREHDEKLARENAEREERRRKDEAERDERRRQQHREDLDRVQAQAAATLAQTQQFFAQVQTLTKDSSRSESDPVKLMMAGIELALKLRGDGAGDGGGDPKDALTALLSRLPETLAEVRSTAKEAYQEIKGKKGAPPAARALPPAGGEEVVTITGKTAVKLKGMISALERAGKDPEAVLAGLADHVSGQARQPTASRSAPPARISSKGRTAKAPRAARAARPARAAKPKAAARRAGQTK